MKGLSNKPVVQKVDCCSTVVPPFDIQIGRCAVVQDSWGNQLVLLDAGKGLLITDAEGNVIGNAEP